MILQEFPRDLEQIKNIWDHNYKEIGRNYHNAEMQQYYKLGEVILYSTNCKEIKKKFIDRQYRKAINIYFAFQKNPDLIKKLHKTQTNQFYYLNQYEVKKIAQATLVTRFFQ